MGRADLFSDQRIQSLPGAAIQALIAVATFAGDLVEQFGIANPFHRRQPHLRMRILLGDFGERQFCIYLFQCCQPQFRLGGMAQQVVCQICVHGAL